MSEQIKKLDGVSCVKIRDKVDELVFRVNLLSNYPDDLSEHSKNDKYKHRNILRTIENLHNNLIAYEAKVNNVTSHVHTSNSHFDNHEGLMDSIDSLNRRLDDLEAHKHTPITRVHCCVEFARHVTLGNLVFRPPNWTTRASYVKIKWCPFCGTEIKHD